MATYVCPDCGGSDIGVWQVRHVMLDVLEWDHEGKPTEVDDGILVSVNGAYQPPHGEALYMCACGHEFDAPQREG